MLEGAMYDWQQYVLNSGILRARTSHLIWDIAAIGFMQSERRILPVLLRL